MGGGGKTTTQSSGFSPELQAKANTILGQAINNQSQLGQVAGTSALQDKAFGQASTAADNANSYASSLRDQAAQPFAESSAYRDAQQSLGLSNFGGNSTGGRARLDQGQIGQDAFLRHQDRANQLGGQALGAEQGAISGLAQLGGQQRGVEQEGLDSYNKQLSALGGLFQGFGGKQSTTTSGGK